MSKPESDIPNGRFEKTVRRLREQRPRPSSALIARVERIAERGLQRTRRDAIVLRPTRRRLAFVLVAVLLASLAGAVVADQRHGTSNGPAALSQPASELAQKQLVNERTEADKLGSGDTSISGVAATANRPRAAVPSSSTGVAPITTGNRLADLRAELTIHVKNRAELSRATAWSMRIARSLNGYVVTADFNDASDRGEAVSFIELKVPANRAQEALTRIASLGEILSQHVSLEDVQRTVATETTSIRSLQRQIGEIERTLREEPLTVEARSQLQVQLASARARLRALELERAQTRLRGQLATISLTLTTGQLAKPAHVPGRIEKAFDDARDRLSAEIAWVVKAAVIASPFLLIGVGLIAFYRVRRRREEQRLLDR